ncbi:MAG: histidine kinase [Saprospiraceae bacterium]|nr:histidine kinase [Saprospiraceae bacterium]
MYSKPKYYAVHILALLLIPVFAQGQQLYFRQFTTQEGLPSGTVYNVAQDQEGFIWISTESGLCKFDGRNFYPDPIKKLKGEEVIGVHVDRNNRKWVFPLNCNAIVYTNDSIVQINKKIDANQCITDFDQISSNYLSLSTMSFNNFILNNKDLRLVEYQENASIGKKTIIETNDAQILILSQKGVFNFIPQKALKPLSTRSPLSNVITKHNIRYNEFLHLITDGKQIWWFDERDLSFRKAIPELWKEEYFINDILKDANQNIWLSTSNGIYQIQHMAQTNASITTHLEGIFMHTIFEDHDQNLWFSSRKKGLFLLVNTDIQVYGNDDSKPSQYSVLSPKTEKHSWAALNNARIRIIDQYGNTTKNIQLEGQAQIYDIIETPSSTLICSDHGLYRWDHSNQLKKLYPGSIKTAIQTADEKIYIGQHNGAHSLDRGYSITRDRTYKLFLQEDNLWLGTVRGLQRYHLPTQQLEEVQALLNKDIRDICPAPNQQLWLATKGHGIYVYHDGQIIKQLDQTNGLLSNNCKQIIHTEQYTWAATNRGLARIDRSNFQIQNLSKQIGLPSNEISAIRAIDSILLIGTNNGLAILSTDIDLNYRPADPKILGVKINGIDTTLIQKYFLNHHENNLVISFTGIHFKEGDNIRFQYKMVGRDKQWLESQNDIAFYSQLKPGFYNFLLKAKIPNTDWSDPLTLKFYIAPPFWNEWWFITLGFLFAAFIFGAFFYWINQLRNRKERLESKLGESQLRALRSQMNPHFIFNALNAIQGFIFQEDRRAANRYLSYFSKLMRNAFFYSDKSEIPLKAELENLELYLKLEALRFEEDLKYEIIVDANIPTEYTQIPSMILQPYLENAINNGIMHIQGEKKLIIRLHKEGEQLICEIDDNGINRNEARMIRQRNQLEKSKSLGATFERLRLFNAGFKNKILLEEITLTKKENGFDGTRIRMIVNKVFNYEE